jgi:chaperonin GroES
MATELTAQNCPIDPLEDHLIVRRTRTTQTAGGIVLPQSQKDKSLEQGEVIAAGPGRVLENGNLRPMSCTPGDRIVFSGHAAFELGEALRQVLKDFGLPSESSNSNQDFVLLSQGNVVARLKRSPNGSV